MPNKTYIELNDVWRRLASGGDINNQFNNSVADSLAREQRSLKSATFNLNNCSVSELPPRFGLVPRWRFV